MTRTTRLELRVPGTSLPPEATFTAPPLRAVGRAAVLYGSTINGWSSDARTLARLLSSMRQQCDADRSEAA